jgi:transposase
MMLSAGQMNDQKGANILVPLLPPARELIADRGYDSNPFRAALAERGITACIPPRKNRKQPIPYDKALYRQRHRIEIMFGRLKDWRRIAMRYDRCAHTFFSAITLAATVIFWLGE